MKEEIAFLKKLVAVWAVDECNSYGHIADILAVNPCKKEIMEYEFKRTSYDLKIAEKRKEKYKYQLRKQYHYKYKRMARYSRVMPRPHKFYYVMPFELWEKEKDYLMQEEYAGVIVWEYTKNSEYPLFKSVKRVKKRESNLQKYDAVLNNICSRATNIARFGRNYSFEEYNKKVDPDNQQIYVEVEE